jgi:serine/threonine protein kinase
MVILKIVLIVIAHLSAINRINIKCKILIYLSYYHSSIVGGIYFCKPYFNNLIKFSGGMKVAVKIQKVCPERMDDIQEEYRVLRDLSSHPNLPDFYGAYLQRTRDGDHLWFVMQVIDGIFPTEEQIVIYQYRIYLSKTDMTRITFMLLASF